MIQLHRLEGFYWVAHTGGYSRAARAFPYPITQPAVHQQVKKLEAEIGVTLFERIGKDRMHPTAAGKALFTFIRPFFEQLPGVVRALSSGDFGGELIILAQGLALRHLLPGWLRKLKKKKPGIRLHLKEMLTLDLSPLRTGEVDLAVGFMPEVPDDVAAKQIATLFPFVVMPEDHRLAGRKRLDLRSFCGETFISYNPGHLAHDLQMRVLAENQVIPGHVISVDSADTILGYVEAGLGFSLVPFLDPGGPQGRGVAAQLLKYREHHYPMLAMWRKETPEHLLLDAALETAPRC